MEPTMVTLTSCDAEGVIRFHQFWLARGVLRGYEAQVSRCGAGGAGCQVARSQTQT